MTTFLFYLMLIITSTSSKLVIDISEYDTIGHEEIVKSADLVDSWVTEPQCNGSQFEVRLFEFWTVDEEGTERRETAEIRLERKYEEDSEYLGNNGVRNKVSYKPHVNCMQQDSPELIAIIKEEVLIPPAPGDQPYNSELLPDTNKVSFTSTKQDLILDKFVFRENVKNGFFIEAGAVDFIYQSNTLLFELDHQWSGLLVEAHPLHYPVG